MEAVAAVDMEVVVAGVMVMEVVVADLDTMDKSEWATSS